MATTDAVYNAIGQTYDATRRADDSIVKTLIRLLNPGPQGRYLDIACGSGNYTDALWNQGISTTGIDVSETMLSKAWVKNPSIIWHQGDVQNLPFENDSFAGAICTLAIHHFEHLGQVFQEAHRVISQGQLVIFTATPEQMKTYWLKHYFPEMMKDAQRRMPSQLSIENAYWAAGFTRVKSEPFFITNTLTDLFLYSGKHRPEIYLDERIRLGISSFQLSANQDEVAEGLANLRRDIASGGIRDVVAASESSGGDYLFFVGEKEARGGSRGDVRY